MAHGGLTCGFWRERWRRLKKKRRGRSEVLGGGSPRWCGWVGFSGLAAVVNTERGSKVFGW